MQTGPREVVLDSWVVAQHLKTRALVSHELRSLLSKEVPEGSRMSMATIGELESVLSRMFPVDEVDGLIDDLIAALRIVRTNLPVHRAAARIRQFYRMSFADSYVAATAVLFDGEVWTGDRELLCTDRIWHVRDVRSEQDRQREVKPKAVGFRMSMADQRSPASLLDDIQKLLGV